MILHDQRNRYMCEKEFVKPISQRMRIKKDLGLNFISSQAATFLVEGTRGFVINMIPMMVIVKSDRQKYKKAITFQDFIFWKELMNKAMYSILSNKMHCIHLLFIILVLTLL